MMPGSVSPTRGTLILLTALSMVAPARAQMAWDPFINECMTTGKHRAECFELLPPDLLAELEAYEAEQREMRRAQMAVRRALNQAGGPTFGQAGDSRSQGPDQPRHAAVLLLQPKRFEVALPTAVDEPFLMQLFEIAQLGGGQVIRVMRAATEITDGAPEGTMVPMVRPYGDAFYLHSDALREDYYVRLIRARSLTYRDYKPTLADYRPDGTIFLEGYVESHVDFTSYVTDQERPIAQSPPIRIHIVRQNEPHTPPFPDYSHNTGFVEGLPPSVSQPLPLASALGWHYTISGIYFTEAGGEHYLFRGYGRDETGQHIATGYRGFDIDDLRARNFQIDEIDYAGE